MVARTRETTDRWVTLSPLEDRAHRRKIQLALAAGDRVAALRAYDTCREVLQRELGVAPAPETEAIAQRRAEILVELALTCWWLLDLGAMERHASEALSLAERCGRGDLATTTMAVLASGDSASGNLSSAIERDQRARLQALELGLPAPTHMLPLASSVLYWLGG